MQKWRLTRIAALVLLFSVGILAAQARAEVIVERVVPNKILYSLNENATAVVWIKNSGSEAAQGQIVAYETRGLDAERKVASVNITLAAGEERKNVSISWNVGPEMYGRGLRVDFAGGGKTVSSAGEFYQVADQWLRTNIIAGWKPGKGLPQELGLFETYNNHGMRYAWAPDDFSDMTPDTDGWYSGHARYGPYSLERFKARIGGRQRTGGRASTYAKFMFAGPNGFEFAREHPEWVVRKKNGSFHTGYKSISPVDLAKPITHKQPSQQQGIVDFYDPAAVEYGAREIAASAKMMGWDGAMFDGHFNIFPGYSWDGLPTPHGENPNELSARNIRLCRDVIRRELPNFALWYNGIYEDTIKQPFKSVWGNNGGPEGQVACLEDPNSGLLVEEQGLGFIQEPWQHWYDFYADRRDETVQRFSTVMNSGWLWNYDLGRSLTPEEIDASREGWVAASHMGSIFLAFQVHPCWNTTYASRPFTQFMTRYSALIWDIDVKKIDEPEKVLDVKSEREVWWKKGAYVKENDEETICLVHLLNTPTTETPDWKVTDDPPAASDVELTFKVPAGKTVEKAWALRPYQWGETEHSPVETELKIEDTDGSVKVKIPSFQYHTLVVFKMKR